MSGGIGGMSIFADRHGVPDGQGPNFARLATAASNDVRPRPLVGPSSKIPLPFDKAYINGREYQGDPWRVEGAAVFQAVANAAPVAAAAIAAAEGITEVAVGDDGTAGSSVCLFRVPDGCVALVTEAQVRYGDNLALTYMKASIQSGGAAEVINSGSAGRVINFAIPIDVELDAPIRVALRVEGGQTIRFVFRNTDTAAPHVVRAMMRGVLFPNTIYE